MRKPLEIIKENVLIVILIGLCTSTLFFPDFPNSFDEIASEVYELIFIVLFIILIKFGKKLLENMLLVISIGTLLGLFILGLLFPDFRASLDKNIGLEFYQLMLLALAIITLIWTNKKYKQGEQRFEQGNNSIFLNQANAIYLDLIKSISDDKIKQSNLPTNLINAIQFSIDNHYTSDEDKRKITPKILNFSYMNLSKVNFKRAHLIGVNLMKADLRGADLTRAYLIEASLTGADLTGADLTKANLRVARLGGADFSEADLRGADLSKARYLDIAIFKDTVYSATTKGLTEEIKKLCVLEEKENK